MIKNLKMRIAALSLLIVALLTPLALGGEKNWSLSSGGIGVCTTIYSSSTKPEVSVTVTNDKDSNCSVKVRSSDSVPEQKVNPGDSTTIVGKFSSVEICIDTKCSAKGTYKVVSISTGAQLTVAPTLTVPTLTHWGLIGLGVLLASSIAWVIRRKIAHRPASA